MTWTDTSTANGQKPSPWITTPYGVSYTSPSGTTDDATQIKLPDGTVQNVIRNPDGTRSYATVNSATQSPTPPPGTTQADSSARAIIDGALGQYGLTSLSNWAWTKWTTGESIDQIMLELRNTPEYKTRFPAMESLSKSGHAISESQYINYEQSAASIFKAAGLPSGFYDGPEDFGKFLANNIALPELQDRVKMYQTAAFSQPPEVLDAWHNLYGMSSGDLVAFFIDPDRAAPLIQTKFAAATAAGYSAQSGFGQLNQSQAEMVGKLGLSDQALSDQFGQLAGLNPLLSGLQGTGENTISTDTALGAGFNHNAADAALLEQRKAQRLGTFQGGGTVATTQQGAVGAGSAR